MVEAIKAGKSVKAVASEFGRNAETVRRACRDAGVRCSCHGSAGFGPGVIEAREMVRQGQHLDVVAGRLKVSQGWLRAACRAAGIRWTLRSGREQRPWLRAAIAERAKEGWKAIEIADDLSVTTATVYTYARDAGVKFQQNGRHPSCRRAKGIEMAKAGASTDDIVKALGVARQTVWKYRKAAGVTAKRDSAWRESERRQIIKLWRSGFSFGQIAARTNLSRSTIAGIIVRAGEQRKNWGRKPRVEKQIAA